MKIDKVEVGPLGTNCYLLSIENKVLVIDPGDEFEKIKEEIGDKTVVGIIITHYHFDHIGALDELKDFAKCKTYDFKNLKSGKNKIGMFEFEIIFTPGHKEDLLSVFFEKENSLFCGDFIFEGSIGRWDLEGGNFRVMQESIKNILKYPDEMSIYPGHGNKTTLKQERRNLGAYL